MLQRTELYNKDERLEYNILLLGKIEYFIITVNNIKPFILRSNSKIIKLIMQFYKSSMWLVLCCLSFFLISCGESKTDEQKKVDLKTLDWAKRTSFKLDFNEENSYIYDLKRSDRSLVEIILDGVEKGTITAFHFSDKKPMSKQEVDQLFHPKDTVTVFDIDVSKEVIQPTVGELNRAAIQKVRIEQEWYFDEKSLKMTSRILGLTPMETIYNSDGSVRGEAPLFWVEFN